MSAPVPAPVAAPPAPTTWTLPDVVRALVHVDPGASGRRARIVDQMLVCSARPHCRCCAPGVDEFTCECVSPFEPLTRRERRRPGCIYCGAPMHGVRP